MKPASASSIPRRRASPSVEWSRELPSQVVSLSNGHYTVRLSEVGSGYSECRGAAVTRWTGDETCDADGFHIYLQDLEIDHVWSAGYQPTREAAQQYDFHCERGVAEIVRLDSGIECRLTVCVSPQYDFEIRRCQLTNLGEGRRRLSITSYLEWVLGNRDADANHPAFSKLFVETDFCAEHRAILARRRPRHGGETDCWGFHAVIGGPAADQQGPIEFETNRARFIGRGHTIARPKAIVPGAILSGDRGSVLDPIASLRVALELKANESQVVAFVLGAAPNRAEVARSLEVTRNMADVERVFNEVRSSSLLDDFQRDPIWPTNGSGKPERVIIHSPHRSQRTSAAVAPEISYLPAGVEALEGQPGGSDTRQPLQFENGYGGFSADGREYVIRLSPEGREGSRRPPLPWINVIANEHAGFLVTESGAGYTWSGNSRLNRLTAWHNDPVTDPHSEALWIRDEDAGVFWSPLPGPTPAASEYLVRHGFGYTTFEHESHGLLQETTLFVAADEPVKLTRIRLVNRSNRTRRLSLFSYLHWALGGLAGESSGQIDTEYDANEQVIWATNPNREHYGGCVAFSTLRIDGSPQDDSVAFSCDRASFLGRDGDARSPAAIAKDLELDRRAGSELDPCAAWQVSIELPPDREFECTYLLGETVDRVTAARLIDKFGNKELVQQALSQVKAFWRDAVSGITIETPDREIDLLVNGWLVYQNLSCRIWGRSAYYQSGGAFGFRDQLQDAAALVYHCPEITRSQILRHAAQQFDEGDVLHWWHPDTGYGLRTRFSDDLLWMPFVTADYIQKSGDVAILQEELPFLTAARLADGQAEVYLRPAPSGKRATLYEHCCRALDLGLTSGQHGLPLIGCGDWNDGFSRVGHLGRGESVWLGFFIDYVLERMLPICSQHGDQPRVAQYTAYRERLRAALDSAGWDGAWFRRAYYDNGQPIGSATSDECQIDALVQAWAVLSGIASGERAENAVQAVEDRLVCNEAALIRLLTPAFNSTPNDPGYIKGYLPGIRENGGQYTHGVLWFVRAMAELGHGSRAVELLRMLTPIWHTRSKAEADTYQTEPYVVAADVYGEPPHVGRGGWTWYTGSAGWMFRVAVESILGFTTENGDTIVMNPSISATWPKFRLNYRLPDGKTCFEIAVENPYGKERGVTSATLDGQPVAVVDGSARIPLLHDGKSHRVIVRL